MLYCLWFASVMATFAAANYVIEVPLPLRLQWNENHGYCGETAFISSGLMFGQYFSQYDIRVIADQQRPTSSPQTKTQLLLGGNDDFTANALSLRYSRYNHAIRDTHAFLTWVKSSLARGEPVTIGVYMNEYLFYGNTNPNAGDADYDHIVTVFKITSYYNDTQYHDDDVLYFSDHGLWAPRQQPVYEFNATFGAIQGNRKQANSKNGLIYTLPNSPQIGNYGISLSGVVDNGGNTLPVSIISNINYEDPEIAPRSNTRPDATPISLTVTIAGLTPLIQYNVYKYSSETLIPDENFNKNAAQADSVRRFNASSSTYTFIENVFSSDKVIYRCVAVSAP